MKKLIIGFISGIILCGGIVYAASYMANDILYIPTDTSWEVSNIDEAINDLYEKSKENTNIKIYYGSVSNSTSDRDSTTVDLKNYIDWWDKANYHLVKWTSASESVSGSSLNFVTSLDNTTGILTISNGNAARTLAYNYVVAYIPE